ncbi:hypothetical protein Q7P37_010779 [Cladosporium fusiforme]
MSSRANTQASQNTEHAEHSQHDHRRHNRRHRTQHFPPREYTDLTRTDISLIAPILLPKTAKETRSEYEKRTKKRISELPAHLHCKHPLLSSFCSLHSKISPGPIVSLFNSLREEIEDEIPETWTPLVEKKALEPMKRGMVEMVQNLAVVWLGQKFFAERYGKNPPLSLARSKISGCAACTMVLIAADFQTQVALASLFIGRVDYKVWHSSKRIAFFLEWTAARMPGSVRDDSKKLIWEVGKKFRLTRIGSEDAKSKKKRSRVDQEEEEENEFGPGTASYPFSLEPEQREKREGPRRMINSTAQEDIDFQEGYRATQATSLVPRGEPLRESSIYSRTVSGIDQTDLSITDDIEDIIAIYQQGGFSVDEDEYQQNRNSSVDEESESQTEQQSPDATGQREREGRPGEGPSSSSATEASKDLLEGPSKPDDPNEPNNLTTTNSTNSAPSPIAALTDLIVSDRHPPGQRAMFAAIDATKPDLSIQDSIAALRTAHETLRGILRLALDFPSEIQGRKDVRAKLQAEYDELPAPEMMDDAIKDCLFSAIKEMVGHRWRVEAMAKQGYEQRP